MGLTFTVSVNRQPSLHIALNTLTSPPTTCPCNFIVVFDLKQHQKYRLLPVVPCFRPVVLNHCLMFSKPHAAPKQLFRGPFSSLDLAPFIEKVEKHCFRQATTQESHGPCAVSYCRKFAKSARPRAIASRGSSGARSSHLQYASSHFMFGTPVAACIQYCILKMLPLCYIWPPFLWIPGDMPDSTKWKSASYHKLMLTRIQKNL